jgi:hypothetical protein
MGSGCDDDLHFLAKSRRGPLVQVEVCLHQLGLSNDIDRGENRTFSNRDDLKQLNVSADSLRL